jgi:uncharacterized membrane protein (DUF106 family)
MLDQLNWLGVILVVAIGAALFATLCISEVIDRERRKWTKAFSKPLISFQRKKRAYMKRTPGTVTVDPYLNGIVK